MPPLEAGVNQSTPFGHPGWEGRSSKRLQKALNAQSAQTDLSLFRRQNSELRRMFSDVTLHSAPMRRGDRRED